MSFDWAEYFRRVNGLLNENRSLRAGQAYMNVARTMIMESDLPLSTAVIVDQPPASANCWNYDSNIPAFLQYLAEEVVS